MNDDVKKIIIFFSVVILITAIFVVIGIYNKHRAEKEREEFNKDHHMATHR